MCADLHNPQTGLEPVFGVVTRYQLGFALRNVRKQRNLTQVELAELTGLSRSQISRIETGSANPNIATVTRLLHALNSTLTVNPLPANRPC